jgi:hypothetical protein
MKLQFHFGYINTVEVGRQDRQHFLQKIVSRGIMPYCRCSHEFEYGSHLELSEPRVVYFLKTSFGINIGKTIIFYFSQMSKEYSEATTSSGRLSS